MRLGKSDNPEIAQSVQGETQLKFKWNPSKFWDDRDQERLQRVEFERKLKESKMSLDQLKVDVEKRDEENKKRLRRDGGREDAIGEEID